MPAATEAADSRWDARLRAAGYRITAPRRAVLASVERLRHATPDEILADVRHAGGDVNLATVYRTLEVLERVGLVSHAHLAHGAPTYHAVDHHAHVHLVCDGCRRVTGIPAEDAADFVARVRASHGFDVDVGHLTLHGRCVDCVAAGRPRGH